MARMRFFMRKMACLVWAVGAAGIIAACASSTTSTGGTQDGGGGGGDAASTGDGGGGSDGSTAQDAGTTHDSSTEDTGSTMDSGPSLACQAYCTCMQSTCPTQSPAGAGCLAACASQTTWDLACRTQHCGYASSMSDPVTHCPHAGGVSTCL